MSKVSGAIAQSVAIGHPDFLTAAPLRRTPATKAVIPANSRDTADLRHLQQASFNPAAGVAALFGGDGNEPDGPVVASGFAQRAIKVFARIDTDKDGHLTDSEVNKALHNAAFKGEDAAVVSTLYDRIDDLEELADDEFGDENDGVTKADLQAFERLATTAEMRTGADNRYGSAIHRQSSVSRQLFPNGKAGINAAAVKQGGIGSCYFLAPLAGLANANPGAIQRMIKDNGNGTYTVSFPGKTPVTVDQPTDAEIGLGATAGANGTWVTVLEKAFAKLRSSETDYQAIEGGSQSDGIALLTGKATSTWNISLNSNSGVKEAIATALKENRVVTANIRPGLLSTSDTREGLPTRHVYTIVGIDPKTAEIIVRNPWGSGGPKGDGIHRFTTEGFCDLFRSVSFQGR